MLNAPFSDIVFSKYGHLYKIRKYIFFSKWKKIKEARINYLLIKVKR